MRRIVMPPDLRALVRFATVGIVSNGLLFLLYLALVGGAGLRPVAAATLGWVVAVIATFLANRSWTFGDTGPALSTFVRYGALYAAAYVLNISLLVVVVDGFGLPHEIVQGTLIVLVGLSLFIGQRVWVFRGSAGA